MELTAKHADIIVLDGSRVELDSPVALGGGKKSGLIELIKTKTKNNKKKRCGA